MFILNFINANVINHGPGEYLKLKINTPEQNDYLKLLTQQQYKNYNYNIRSKRNFGIKLYYEIIELDDGRLVSVPRDVNKNHYFIG